MVTGTGDEAETQEEEEDDDERDDLGSQVSLNSSIQENDAYTLGPFWYNEDNKLDHKRIRPVRRL